MSIRPTFGRVFAISLVTAWVVTFADAAEAPNPALGGGQKFQSGLLSKAQSTFVGAATTARQAYHVELDAALKGTMSAGDLAEANAINSVKAAIASGGLPPKTTFKSPKATQAQITYDAAFARALEQYTTVLRSAQKTAMSTGNLDDANRIQDELTALTASPDKAPAGQIETKDFITSGKGFTIGTLENGTAAFSNRNYVWLKIPPAQRGMHYTKMAGGSHPHIVVHAKRKAVLQVISSPDDPGVKMIGWERTGIQWHYSDGKPSRIVIYKKTLEAGEDLELPQGSWIGALPIFPAE